MRARLMPVDSSNKPIEITKDLVVVGRNKDCDVRLNHKSVSKLHCVIIKTDGLLILRDLGSTNGTRVNGTRVRRASLLPNDQLQIAHFRFKVWLGPDEDQPAAIPVHEHTMTMDRDEVERLKQQPDAADVDFEVDEQPEPLHRNQLPDVYDNG